MEWHQTPEKSFFFFPQLPKENTSVKEENHVNEPVTYRLHGKVKTLPHHTITGKLQDMESRNQSMWCQEET